MPTIQQMKDAVLRRAKADGRPSSCVLSGKLLGLWWALERLEELEKEGNSGAAKVERVRVNERFEALVVRGEP